MKKLIQRLESKILTKLFTRWVHTEYDLELLSMTKVAIANQETKLNQMIGIATRVEIVGYRIGS